MKLPRPPSVGTLAAIFAMALTAAPHVHAVDITPSNLQGWAPFDMRFAGTADINTDYAGPSHPDGSLNLSSTASQDKAGYALDWNTTSNATPFGVITRLSDLVELSYQWYRDNASTSAGNLAPSLQLSLYTDVNNDGPQTTDFANLVFEPVYNLPPGNVPTNLWMDVNALAGNVWQFRQGGTGVIARYDLTIAEWLDVGVVQPVGSLPIDSTTYVLGIRTGIGAGWSGTFDGAVDNVAASFIGGTPYNANFAVPEPSVAMFGILALGFCALRRRR